MNILILTTYFPPDTSIASVRPYMLAKYLGKIGYKVTIIRSGQIVFKPDSKYSEKDLNADIISYYGPDCDAEKWLRGEYKAPNNKTLASKLPYKLKEKLKRVYEAVFSLYHLYRLLVRTNDRYKLQKKAINSIKDRHFDVVFATFGDLENVYAGEYASKVFNCKYILDFRDLIAEKQLNSAVQYRLMRILQKRALKNADLCTAISEGMKQTLLEQVPDTKIIVLYNGFEKSCVSDVPPINRSKKLAICYAGSMYGSKRDATPMFEAISNLVREDRIDINNIEIQFAGSEFGSIQNQAKKFNVESTLINRGYLSKNEVDQMQRESDVFLLLSWNTKYDQGVLTGKFYESLRNKRPVLACVSGNVPESELFHLINKYKLGFCFEYANKRVRIDDLAEFIYRLYIEKQENGYIDYSPDEKVYCIFEYESIAKRFLS